MAMRDEPRSGGYVFIAVLFVAILIDAFLFAQVHANFVHDHGYTPDRDILQSPSPPRPDS